MPGGVLSGTHSALTTRRLPLSTRAVKSSGFRSAIGRPRSSNTLTSMDVSSDGRPEARQILRLLREQHAGRGHQAREHDR